MWSARFSLLREEKIDLAILTKIADMPRCAGRRKDGRFTLVSPYSNSKAEHLITIAVTMAGLIIGAKLAQDITPRDYLKQACQTRKVT